MRKGVSSGRGIAFAAGFVFLCSVAGAEIAVFERTEPSDIAPYQRLLNASFEDGDEAPLPHWFAWQEGYALVEGAGRGGSRAIRCSNESADLQYGAGQTVTLNQDRPRLIVAEGWSRAESVDGSPTNGYSLYLDIEFMDGTNLWGQTAPFSTGTHDWEQRRFLVVPDKPVKHVCVYPLFRGHRGTVYFDDFSLAELPDEEVHLFEGVPVRRPTPAGSSGAPTSAAATADGLSLRIEPERTVVTLDGHPGMTGGPAFFVRDVAADSTFLAPGAWEGEGKRSARLDTLGLRLDAELVPHPDRIEVRCRVEDLRGEDRAVTVYFALPVTGDDWIWHDDMRAARPATKGLYMRARRSGIGAFGQWSVYPLAAMTGPRGGLALAAPLDEPRHHRLAYDASSGVLFAAFDLGLSPDAARMPRAADFRCFVYRTDPEWGFRAALDRYYTMFPQWFVKRVDREGLWMAFTDISTVHGWEDFGFAFKEGCNNVPWDEQHGILTFVYTEPMTTWLPLPAETPRTYAGAVGHVESQLTGTDAAARRLAAKTVLSAVHTRSGDPVAFVQDAPWCDGAVFALNADPELPVTEAFPENQAQHEFSTIEAALEPQGRGAAHWTAHAGGYTLDEEVAHRGGRSLRVRLPAPGDEVGAVQYVTLRQTVATPLVLRAHVRAQDLTGPLESAVSVYVDLEHVDGTPLYGRALPVAPGTYDFVALEGAITSDKPFRRANVYCLMRGKRTGAVWFDDVFLGEAGSDVNLIENGGFEADLNPSAEVDGAYIDSFSFFATTLNYNRAHFASADIPLVFDTQTHEVGILTFFSTMAFERELARRMHGRGKLVMANAPLHNAPYPACHLDVLGTEANWFPGGEWSPFSDAELNQRRAMCFQKPFCFLLNTRYADLTLEMTERYMQRSLFYGMFPGFFSENASTHCYFETPEWYEPARPLFRKYVPAIQRIAAAGWQPVTHARASDPRLYVERFGEADAGEVFFTVMNEHETEAIGDLTVDLAALGWAGTRIEARDLLDDAAAVEAEADAARLTIGVSLAPWQAGVYRLAPSDEAAP